MEEHLGMSVSTNTDTTERPTGLLKSIHAQAKRLVGSAKQRQLHQEGEPASPLSQGTPKGGVARNQTPHRAHKDHFHRPTNVLHGHW